MDRAINKTRKIHPGSIRSPNAKLTGGELSRLKSQNFKAKIPTATGGKVGQSMPNTDPQ
jgi:hypothetical protein